MADAAELAALEIERQTLATAIAASEAQHAEWRSRPFKERTGQTPPDSALPLRDRLQVVEAKIARLIARRHRRW